MTGADVEREAVRWVIETETAEGRKAEDSRHRDAPADVESDERIIEIKAFGGTARGEDLWLETRQVDEARAHPDRFWLYIVENIRQGDANQYRLIGIGGADLAHLLEKARERRHYEVPWPVAEYDRLTKPPT